MSTKLNIVTKATDKYYTSFRESMKREFLKQAQKAKHAITEELSNRVANYVRDEAAKMYEQIIYDYYMDYTPSVYQRTYNLQTYHQTIDGQTYLDTFIPPIITHINTGYAIKFRKWYTSVSMRPYHVTTKWQKRHVTPENVLNTVMDGIRGIDYQLWKPTEARAFTDTASPFTFRGTPNDMFQKFERHVGLYFERYMIAEYYAHESVYDKIWNKYL